MNLPAAPTAIAPPVIPSPLRAPSPSLGERDDPFFYGYRYLRRYQPDGSIGFEAVPLTQEDTLFPLEGDQIMSRPTSALDMHYCHVALVDLYRNDEETVVLSDCRVDWNVMFVPQVLPDILVIFGVKHWLRGPTYRLGEEGGRAVLAMEMTSQTTWENDIGRKMDIYYRAGLPKYILVDRGPSGEDPAVLRGYVRGKRWWEPMQLDAKGRLSLDPVPVTIGLEGDAVRLYHAATGEPFLREDEAKRLAQGATARALDAEAEADRQTTARADAEAERDRQAKARADAEAERDRQAKARADAEAERDRQAKARTDAEAETNRQAKARANAEAKAKKAARARAKEAKARADAEAKARDEAAQRELLEQRLRDLEAQLRQHNPPPP